MFKNRGVLFNIVYDDSVAWRNDKEKRTSKIISILYKATQGKLKLFANNQYYNYMYFIRKMKVMGKASYSVQVKAVGERIPNGAKRPFQHFTKLFKMTEKHGY